jgi:hypothetical protein
MKRLPEEFVSLDGRFTPRFRGLLLRSALLTPSALSMNCRAIDLHHAKRGK